MNFGHRHSTIHRCTVPAHEKEKRDQRDTQRRHRFTKPARWLLVRNIDTMSKAHTSCIFCSISAHTSCLISASICSLSSIIFSCHSLISASLCSSSSFCFSFSKLSAKEANTALFDRCK